MSDDEMIETFQASRDSFEEVVKLIKEEPSLHEETSYVNSQPDDSASSNITQAIKDDLKDLKIKSLRVSRSASIIDFFRYDPKDEGLLPPPILKGYTYVSDEVSDEGWLKHASLDDVKPCCQVPQYREINDNWYLHVPHVID